MGVHLYRTLLPVVLLAYVRGETCEAVGDGWASLTLDDTISYVAYHKVVDGELHLRLSAAHSGWLGFGFAEPSTGHMKGADLVTVSVSNSGMVTVDDRYAGFAATTYTPPTYLNGFSDLTAHLDVSNDWTIVSGQQESGVTNVWIKRALVTNDSQDRTITAGMTRVVWSYGSGDSVSYHGGNRGTLSTIFFGTDTHAFPAYDGKWTRRFTDYAVPGDKITTYACQSFTFPTDKERHIVALRPIGVTKYNHHAILHICTDNAYFSDHTSPQLCSYHADNEACPGGPDGGSGSQCQGSSPLGSGSAQCAGLMWSWAVGMGDFILPPEAGLRTGASQISHVVLEIHYDNPDLTTGVIDSMGFEAFYVETPRQHDAGILIVGDTIVNFGDTPSNGAPPFEIGHLPKGLDYIHRQATCPNECTQDFSAPINVFAAFHHMHYYGSKFITEKYSAGGVLQGAVGKRIDFWDNGFQQAQFASYTIQPGESLQTHCYYDTSSYSYSNAVEFSTPTSSEMCQDFLFYYPRQTRNSQPFAFCGYTKDGTICGAISQGFVNGAPLFILPMSTQLDRGNSSYIDPLFFGDVNSAEKTVAPVATCTVPTGDAIPAVLVTWTLAGDVSSVPQDAIKTAIANATAVSVANVALSLVAGSVIVYATITPAAGMTASSVSSAISANLGSAAQASAGFGVTVEVGAAVTVTTVGAAATTVTAAAAAAAGSEGGCGAGCIGGIVGGAFVPTLMFILWMSGAFTKYGCPSPCKKGEKIKPTVNA